MNIDLNRLNSWKVNRRENKRERKTKWHMWFAWYPVEVRCCEYVWLDFVQRRYASSGNSFYEPSYISKDNKI